MIKKYLALFLAAVMTALLLGGCAPGVNSAERSENTAVRVFTDSVGRNVEVPENIRRVAVSGSMAQMYVFALCPDKLVGLSSDWSEDAKKYIDEKYWDIPVLGQLYGGKGDLNTESLLKSGAQVVIDIGESKESIAEDLDGLQEQSGIPFVHIRADLESTGDAFRMLGELMGMPRQAEERAAFCENILERTRRIAEDVEKVKLLYIGGDLGQNVIAKDSYHSQVIDMLSDNLAAVDNPSSKGIGNEVDMEQIIKWNPDCILISPQSVFSVVDTEPEWQGLTAVRNDRFYEVPYGPYNWMGFPPSCQRYLGMMWMAKLLYPEQADYDLYEDCGEFFRLFFNSALSREQYDQLMENSILKREEQEGF